MLPEVKDVQKLDFTSQLQDFLHCSIKTNRDMKLRARETTEFSESLQPAIEAGWIWLGEFLE